MAKDILDSKKHFYKLRNKAKILNLLFSELILGTVVKEYENKWTYELTQKYTAQSQFI
jgi:hypothetical protein